MKIKFHMLRVLSAIFLIGACSTGGDVVRVTTVSQKADLTVLGEKEMARLAEIKEAKQKDNTGIDRVIQGTPNYTIAEYLARHPEANSVTAQDYKVGGYDVLDITVYELYIIFD